MSNNKPTLAKDLSIVCRCKAVSYKTIRLKIESGNDTIEKIRKATGANTGCGKSCTEKIEQMILEYGKK